MKKKIIVSMLVLFVFVVFNLFLLTNSVASAPKPIDYAELCKSEKKCYDQEILFGSPIKNLKEKNVQLTTLNEKSTEENKETPVISEVEEEDEDSTTLQDIPDEPDIQYIDLILSNTVSSSGSTKSRGSGGGSSGSSSGSSVNCVPEPVCGDGIKEGDEECEYDSDCDDSNPYTKDTCSGSCLCQYENLECLYNEDCNDGDACTTDECINNACIKTPIQDCCLIDSDCDDEVYCNGAETCVGNACQLGTPIECGDSVMCTVDSCNEDADSCDNIPTDSLCNDNLWCDGEEYCDATLDCQDGIAPDCGDGDVCTTDSCDESLDQCINDYVPDCCTCDAECNDGNVCTLDQCTNNECVNNPIQDCCLVDADCDNGLYCDGQEICVNALCVGGVAPECSDDLFCTVNERCDEGSDQCIYDDRDCTGNDITGIDDCFNIPDGNDYTWDYRVEFISVCDEDSDVCTTGSDTITHMCDEQCNAECSIPDDCPEKCTTTSHKLYTQVECTDCECKYSDYECVIGKCGAVCYEDSDCSCEADHCDGTTLVDYPDYGRCGNAGSEGCLCQVDVNEEEECKPTLIPNHPDCIQCGDGIKEGDEECDDGANNGQQCDPPYDGSCTYCSDTCEEITLDGGFCGDDITNGVEECDDGNNENEDGCDENCYTEDLCDEDEELIEFTYESKPESAFVDSGTANLAYKLCDCDYIGIDTSDGNEHYIYMNWDQSEINMGGYDGAIYFDLDLYHKETDTNIKVQLKDQYGVWIDVCDPDESSSYILDTCDLMPYLDILEQVSIIEFRVVTWKSGTCHEYLKCAKLNVKLYKCEGQPECGDGEINQIWEVCELPGTTNNLFCPQTTEECNGKKYALRDGYGDCDTGCGCVDDPLEFECVKDKCNADCGNDNDCDGDSCEVQYDDYCDGVELVDFNGNMIMDSYTKTDSCDDTCDLDACECSDCQVDCSVDPQQYCVVGECGAECISDLDCDDGKENTIDTCNVELCTCEHEPKEPIMKDAKVAQAKPTANFGDGRYMIVNPKTPGIDRSYIRIDLSGYNDQISSASLDIALYYTGSSAPGSQIEAWYCPDHDFDEMTINWQNQPIGEDCSLADTYEVPSAVIAGIPETWHTFDLTDEVNEEINEDKQFTIVIRSDLEYSDITDNSYYVQYLTKDYSEEAYRPKLQIS